MEAGLTSPLMSFTQATGLGQGITGMLPTWENLHSNERQAVHSNIQSFHRAKGYFRGRRNETLSLVFWFETFINWPATVLGIIGLDKSGSLGKLLKLVATGVRNRCSNTSLHGTRAVILSLLRPAHASAQTSARKSAVRAGQSDNPASHCDCRIRDPRRSSSRYSYPRTARSYLNCFARTRPRTSYACPSFGFSCRASVRSASASAYRRRDS